VLFTLAVYFTLRKVLTPLRETSAAAARIDAHNISKRLSTRNLPSEFLPVVDAFNFTLDRLERGYIVQRAFLAGAAHELKTPLALIRANRRGRRHRPCSSPSRSEPHGAPGQSTSTSGRSE
jgi:two-component system, OmpR family, sensor histidine kinase QseC